MHNHVDVIIMNIFGGNAMDIQLGLLSSKLALPAQTDIQPSAL